MKVIVETNRLETLVFDEADNWLVDDSGDLWISKASETVGTVARGVWASVSVRFQEGA